MVYNGNYIYKWVIWEHPHFRKPPYSFGKNALFCRTSQLNAYPISGADWWQSPMNGVVAETQQRFLSNLRLTRLICFVQWLMLSNLETDIPLGPFTFRTRPFGDHFSGCLVVSLQRWSKMLHVSLCVVSYGNVVLVWCFFVLIVCSSCRLLYYIDYHIPLKWLDKKEANIT